MLTLIIFLLLILSGILFLLRHSRLAGNIFLAALLIFWLAGTSFVPYILTENLQSNYNTLQQISWKDNNSIILLGGSTVKDKLKQVIPAPVSYSRIYEAARLYNGCKQAGKQCHIIISGGDPAGNGLSEAESYKRSLLTLGIPSNQILIENKSQNTWENAKFTSQILSKQAKQQTVLVTSAMHMNRALLYFKHFGIHPTPSASDHIEPMVGIAPIGYNLALIDFAVHEYVGTARYYAYEWLGLN